MRTLARVGVDRERNRALGQKPLEVAAVLGLVELTVLVERDDAGRDDAAQVDLFHQFPREAGAAVESRRMTCVGRRTGWTWAPSSSRTAASNPRRPSSRSGRRTVESDGAVIAATGM